MITRIFRVNIDSRLRDEFELKFADISVRAVETKPGFVSSSIGKPTKWAPDEYVMISCWENEQALRNFAGENWQEAVIPAGMDKFVLECAVHHYKTW